MLKYNCLEENQLKPTDFWEDGKVVHKTRKELYCLSCPSRPYRSKECLFAKKLELDPLKRQRSKGKYKSDEYILQVIADLYEELGRPPIFSDFDAKVHGVCYDTIKDRFGGLPQALELVEKEILNDQDS